MAATVHPSPAQTAHAPEQSSPATARALLRTEVESEVEGGTLRRLFLPASIVVAFLAASSAPTPLYQRYNQEWHGTALNTTVAFGIYALAVLVGLLSLAELAEHVGRRPVLLTALAGQSAALVLFAAAGSFTPLVLGRVLQGLATGAALGLLGATMIETHRGHGTVVSAAAPAAGTGLGALLAGVVVGYLPWPTTLIYLLLLVVFAAQTVAVLRWSTPARRRAAALASLRPKLSVPPVARGAFATATPVLFAVWALAGFYGSLGPALSRHLAHTSSIALGGAGLFILASTASLATVVLRRTSAHRLMTVGIGTLIAGMLATTGAIEAGSVIAYFAATAVAGVGFGAGFQGSIRTATILVEPEHRSGLLSAIFVVSYSGMGGPAVVAGYLVSRGHSLTSVSIEYAAALVLLALAAAVGLLRRR